jgi:hypothetical protein
MKYLNLLFISLLLTAFFSCCKRSANLESGFETPPDDVRVGCYWYWIDKTVTKDGVVADLEAMKKAGITRAYIGLTGGGEDLVFMSNQWWDLIRTALKKAAELDIEIGMFNCPGWSQSGGPWIKPSQTMRYLTSVQRMVSGPKKISEQIRFSNEQIADVSKLPWNDEYYRVKPEDFQDVKVLAFPVKTANVKNYFDLDEAKTAFSSNIAGRTFPVKLPEKEESYITLTIPEPVPAQGLLIKIEGRFKSHCELQAKVNGDFVTVKKFSMDRTDTGLSRGFSPFSPFAFSFPKTEASEFRIVFCNTNNYSVVTGISLTEAPVVERFPEKTFAKMFNSLAPPWNAFMWETETADSSLSIPVSDVRDISDCLAADGTLTWDVPEGDWIIMRTGMLPTGLQNSPIVAGGVGLECDKLSAKWTEYHYDSFIGEIIKKIPAEDRKSFKVNVLDSYEKGGQNFTDDFIEIFGKRYGYNPTPYLPAYFGFPVGSPELSDRFLWDMRRLVADKIAYDYVKPMREKSHKDGLVTWLENYGSWGFAGEFLQYGGQSDEVGGEFWLGDYIGKEENRCATSCAHIYGKNKVWSESFTNAGDQYIIYPSLIKKKGDWAISDGINSFILHVNIQQQADDVYPGIDAWYGVQFNRKNTLFSQLDLFTTYLRRCSYMLQKGLDVADAAYFIGEDAPKMCGITDPETPQGYHYDHINAEVLNSATMKDCRLTLPHGAQYRVLVLPPQETMRPEVLRKIKQLVEDGLTVVGNPPVRSPSLENYPQADEQVRSIAAELWGETPVKERTVGKGKIYTNTGLEEIFTSINLPPDFRVEGDAPILYTHRRDGETDIYFITNQSDRPVRFTSEFRVKGKQPEYWDPVLGKHRSLPAFSQNIETITVPLQLEASGSAFIVFRDKLKISKSTGTIPDSDNFPAPELVEEINTPWTVQFESDKIHRGPAEPVTFDKPVDLSKIDDPQIKYYSGTAVYNTVFNISNLQNSKDSNLYLDLGKVGVMAKVILNGQYTGGVWTYPYRVDITKAIKEGDNELRIETVNTWANRIIGDRNLPEEERGLKLNRGPGANSPLMESGLLGPVRILSTKE